MPLNFSKSGAIWDIFQENVENISAPIQFSQIAIEVPHQTVVEINNQPFHISQQLILELENVTISSMKFRETIDALITYQG